MSQSINTNVMSLTAQRNLNSTQGALSTSMQRLSSGLRVNSAKDDAAGLAIAERMNSQVRGMNVAMRNANDAVSYSQTAEGGLSRVGDMLQRMRELAVQSANEVNTAEDKDNLQEEFKQLQQEIERTVKGTKFNGVAVLSTTTSTNFQVGAGTDTSVDQVSISGVNLAGTASSVSKAYATTGTTISINGTTTANTLAAIKQIDSAIKEINTKRATFGAVQNRFDNVIANLQVSMENQAAARGRIMDTDFAQETANLSRSQVLQQAGQAMLSQANAMPNNVLALLR